LTVTDSDDMSGTCGANIVVRDAAAPYGTITFPAAGQCFGPASVPVTVRDSFADACDPNLVRSYSPAGGPAYSAHGDYDVRLTAADASGNTSASSVRFTIDRTPPKVALQANPGNWLLTPQIPFSSLFTDSDDDGATGGVVHEVVSLDGCAAYDGLTYGNRDGLLRDETLPASQDEQCRLVKLCGKRQWTNPTLAITATDCGGNSTTATKTIPGVYQVPTSLCQ
jgi:hypothetical protein